MEKVIHVVSLEEHERVEAGIWTQTTPEERFAQVEAIRQAAWELYGKPGHGLERVLRVTDFPPR